MVQLLLLLCYYYSKSNGNNEAGAEVAGLKTVDGMQLYIDPEECIDCGACEPECPVEAIFDEDMLPDEWKEYIDINANFFKD